MKELLQEKQHLEGLLAGMLIAGESYMATMAELMDLNREIAKLNK